MTKIVITMDVDSEYADPGHPMGLTAAGYEAIAGVLAVFGDNIDINAA